MQNSEGHRGEDSATLSDVLARSSVLGIRVDAGGFRGVVDGLARCAANGVSGYVCVANVHMIIEARSDPALRRVLENALAVVSDGMPLVWYLKYRKRCVAERIAGPELMEALCLRLGDLRVPVFFIGASKEILEGIRMRLNHEVPDLPVAGMRDPGMLSSAPEVSEATVEAVQGAGARVMFVGLGCPKQEYWMECHGHYLNAIQVGVGAAFEFYAGTKRRAPKYLQRIGLEWAYRLWREPRRLAERYLITNTRFVLLVGRELIFGLPK